MCGISGVISRVGVNEKIIRKINQALIHRGPDGEGYQSFENDRIWFGHRRLSIIDLSEAGHQPMCYAGRYWITYNGEVYNYIELKKELVVSGLTFSTKTDAEVILAAYATWGVDCLARFNGMWSFVIYDSEKHQLFFARDRFGIKPLHYYHKDGLFVFASEIKAILRHTDVKTVPNLEYCREYLKNGPREYIAETAFENIQRFPHASYALVSIDKILADGLMPVRYWNLTANLSTEKYDESRAMEYAVKYRELLKDAVSLRLRSDVKVGSALSGGLDSSSIVLFVNTLLRHSGADLEKQETFSTVYPEANVSDCDESRYINLLARELNVKSHQISPKIEDIPDECYKNIYAMDNPPDSSLMSSWHTYKLVSKTDVIVTLDGQGADEQLAGYLRYVSAYIAAIGPFQLKELAKFWKMYGARKYVIYGILLWIIRKSVLRRLWKGATKKSNRVRQSILEPFNEILSKDIQSELINLLHYADRASMAFSLESRMPFMDYRIVEFLATIPFGYKIRSGWTKYIARMSMQDFLPSDIVWRKDKMGWPIPEDYWFRGPLKKWFCSIIERSAFLQKLGVGQDIRSRIEGREPIQMLIRLLNLALWHEIFYEKRDSLTAMHLPSRI